MDPSLKREMGKEPMGFGVMPTHQESEKEPIRSKMGPEALSGSKLNP